MGVKVLFSQRRSDLIENEMDFCSISLALVVVVEIRLLTLGCCRLFTGEGQIMLIFQRMYSNDFRDTTGSSIGCM